MANVEILIKTIIDKAVSDLKQTAGAVGDVDTATKKASTASSQLGDSFKKMAGAMGVGVSIAVLANAVKKFSAEAIEAAARSQELKAKFDVVFGQSAPQAREELDNFGTTVNRSRLELQEMASDMQGVLAAMGLNRAEAADYSVELTKLSVDVAAFNNAQDADVLNAFRAAMTGEYESVKKFGIVINEAAIKAELLTMGISGGTQAATAAEKAMARYNIIMRATADAQGQATLEAGSYTNVTKGLEAAMTDLKVAVGERLIPAMTDFKMVTTDVVTAITDNITRTNLLTEAQNLGLISMQDYILSVRFHTDAVSLTNEELAELILKHQEENGLLPELAGNVSELASKQQEHAAAMDLATTAQRNLEAAQQSWKNNTANQVETALKNINIGGADYEAALRAIDNTMGTNKYNEEQQRLRIDEITKAYGATGNIIEFQDALYLLANDYMPQTSAALETAKNKVEELSKRIEELTEQAEEEIEIKVKITVDGEFPEVPVVEP